MKKSTIKYKKQQNKAKIFSIIAPLIFWGLVVLSILFFYLSLKNSLGNIAEITTLLDSKVYNGEQLAENYAYLVNKYGEWVIGNSNGGFVITFVNIKRAVFNGLMVVELIMSFTCLINAYLWGKWLLPFFAKSLEKKGQDTVNMLILEKYGE